MDLQQVETIYVSLISEGTAVWRPVQAERRNDGTFQILSKNDDPEDEQWEFPSGSIVRCEQRQLADGPCLVAIESVPPPPRPLLRRVWPP